LTWVLKAYFPDRNGSPPHEVFFFFFLPPGLMSFLAVFLSPLRVFFCPSSFPLFPYLLTESDFSTFLTIRSFLSVQLFSPKVRLRFSLGRFLLSSACLASCGLFVLFFISLFQATVFFDSLLPIALILLAFVLLVLCPP